MMIDMKTRGIKLVALLAGIAAGTAGCSNRLAPNGGKGVIMPLAVGNRWIGKTRLTTGAEVFDTLRITRDTTLRREKWYVTSNGALLANHPDGLYIWDLALARRGMGKPRRALKFPIAVGDALDDLGSLTRTTDSAGNAEMVRLVLTVVSSDTLIEVEAGRYHCIQAALQLYNADGSPNHTKLINDGPVYFAPGIGLVKTDGYRPYLGSVSSSDPWQLYSVSLH
jgi:hypothetical protein